VNGVSKEQIARAKEISIEGYILSHEPNNVKRVGGAYYLRDHTSLEISNGLWNWHSRGVGGKNVIDYLIFVRGYAFVDAVRELAGDDRTIPEKARPPTPRTSEQKQERTAESRTPLKLPRRNKDNMRVIAYLRSRGIDRELIQSCIRQGNLYESAERHNAVFLGRDERGKVRFAAMRGTSGNFKRDADGSDKRYGFHLPPDFGKEEYLSKVNTHLYVFESPIDALSHYVISQMPNQETLYGHRLSLGGTALAALNHFLENEMSIERIIICTDNDVAGNRAAAEIAEKYGDRYKISQVTPPNGCKDWNESLLAAQKAERTQNRAQSNERS
jgi:hypothetical protein